MTSPIIFEIVPHVGVGPVLLGRPRHDVLTALGRLGFPCENTHGKLDYFCAAAISVEYDENGMSQFIGVSCEPRIKVMYCGVDVFDTEAKALFALIATNEPLPHTFNQMEYFFPEQRVTLWDADEQYDRLQGESRVIWAQVGLGNEAYVRAIAKIKAKGR